MRFVSILDITPIFHRFNERILVELLEMRLMGVSVEQAFSWLIDHAIERVYNCNVEKHYRHDLFLCIYDKVGHDLEVVCKQYFMQRSMTFSPNSTLRTIVTPCELFIVSE